MTYHIARNGEMLGEFSEDDFRIRRASAAILPTDHYWSEGMTDWKTVAEYRTLARTQRIRIAPELTPPSPIVIAVAAQSEKPAREWYSSLTLIGGVLALLAIALPLIATQLFYLSLASLVVALVLAILSVARREFTGGIILLVVVVLATLGIFFYR